MIVEAFVVSASNDHGTHVRMAVLSTFEMDYRGFGITCVLCDAGSPVAELLLNYIT